MMRVRKSFMSDFPMEWNGGTQLVPRTCGKHSLPPDSLEANLFIRHLTINQMGGMLEEAQRHLLIRAF